MAKETPQLRQPFFISPLFWKELSERSLNREEYYTALDFASKGYTIVDLKLDKGFINRCKKDIDLLHDKDDTTTQADGYHYSKGKRIFEAYKESKAILDLALNKKVLKILKVLYEAEPIPFQTISFKYGSNQPLHSDTIHFDSLPHNYLAACWVALEDMDANNGSLRYVPKSHKLPAYNFNDLGIEIPEYGNQFEAYSKYESFIDSLIGHKTDLHEEILEVPAGHAIIWSATLLHGGEPVRDLNRTRYSNVTHYYFEGCDRYYSPMFSDVYKGQYTDKNIEKKDIRKWKD